METEQQLQYAGGYNGDRYSVSGYSMGDDSYFIKSKNSITARVLPCIDHICKNSLNDFNISIFRNDKFVFSYPYTRTKATNDNYIFSFIDKLSINILFQLDEVELDKLIPMIKDSKEHSFSFDRKTSRYYIHCQSVNPAMDEFIIHKFNDKFYFDECSLYRKNMSVHTIIKDYSHFSYSELSHSLSDDDTMLSLSGHYSTWFMFFNSQTNVIHYLIDTKHRITLEETKEDNTIQVKDIDDFYDKSFDMVFAHIRSPDYMTNSMSAIIESYDIDPKQHWRDFIRLFDMATI